MAETMQARATRKRLSTVRRVRYSWAPADATRELAYEQDFGLDEDETVHRRSARVEALLPLLDKLSETEWLCLFHYVIDGGYAIDGAGQWRAVARTIGTNPETGEQIDDKTVKRAVLRAVDKLRDDLTGLPMWQQLMLGLPTDEVA